MLSEIATHESSAVDGSTDDQLTELWAILLGPLMGLNFHSTALSLSFSLSSDAITLYTLCT
jgi:hypothetical protein